MHLSWTHQIAGIAQRTKWLWLFAQLLLGTWPVRGAELPDPSPFETPDRTARWLTGDALWDQLERPVSLQWRHTPVRDGLIRLAEAQGVAIFLDRTLDPDRKLEITIDDQPLREALRAIARSLEADVGYVGPVVYIGPPHVAHRIATLAELQNQRVVQRLPDRYRPLLRPAPLRWERLAEPRDLLQQCIAQSRLAPGDLSLVPHDVWPGYDLPPMTWAEQLTLLLAGFRMSFVISPAGDRVQWTTFPQVVSLRREYSVGSRAPALAKQWAEEFPQATVTVENDRLVVRSTLEEHRELARRLRGRGRPARAENAQATHRYTLTVKQQPLGKVLEAVAAKFERELVWDEDVMRDDPTRISFSVKDATEQELLDSILSPSGLAADIDDRTIRIRRQETRRPVQ